MRPPPFLAFGEDARQHIGRDAAARVRNLDDDFADGTLRGAYLFKDWL